ncbi:MAG: CoA protein activase [Nitrospira sp.]|nr:CoA protein activase [Nitrospira sp.]
MSNDVEKFLKRHEVNSIIHGTNGNVIDAYLGVDIGSISTNLAVIDSEGRLLAKRYLMTAGRPINAVMTGLEEIGNEVGARVRICGVGTTGSGRYMIADFIGADVVKNEITAQARAAVEIDPEVDTILEIGGQDSKYISIKDGAIVDFEMNKACAAGTGSFLEEQAEKLDLCVKTEFAETAFRSSNPCSLGERCTVFMENSLLSRQQKGSAKEDLTAGLAYSIVQNYLNRVVDGRPIGKKVFFQGGVAFNRTVVAAFEKHLDRHIIIPPHHDVTGAIGMALIARSTANEKASSDSGFKGFDLSKRQYDISSFECKSCDNLCEINRVRMEGEEKPLFYGSRCEKYDVVQAKDSKTAAKMPDLFAERDAMLLHSHNEYRQQFESVREGLNGNRPLRIGLPRIFFFHDLLPYWSTLLWELGFEVELSSATNRSVINKGVESILSESCFPHKVAHGHIKDLLDKDVDAVFIPSFISFSTSGDVGRSFACPYAQTMPYIGRAAFPSSNIISPVINYEGGRSYMITQLYKTLKPLGITKPMLKKAIDKADLMQKNFMTSVKRRGREVLGNLPGKTMVIVGRAYNAFDPGINLEIPKKLAMLGVFSIPMDFLPLEAIDISEKWENMYWRSGQNILKAAEIIRGNPDLYALFIGNFSCGPDSFIQRFFSETMGAKSWLYLEIDEHSADAGAITRCEAFLDSIEGRGDNLPDEEKRSLPVQLNKDEKDRLVYIPRMSDHAFGIAAAFETCGLKAEVMAIPDNESVRMGRKFLSGKECYPCAITTGDMVRQTTTKDFDPKKAVFFIPSGAGPCRFGQYNVMQRRVLDELGYKNVPIFAPNQDESFYRDLGLVGNEFAKKAWKGIVVVDLLIKCLHETRPYEKSKGETEALYNNYLQNLVSVLNGGKGAVEAMLKDARKTFSAIPRYEGKRPLIGVVGEIFVRLNSFANEQLIKKVEELGGEVWMAPLEEWISYINLTAFQKSVFRYKVGARTSDVMSNIVTNYIKGHVQSGIEKKYAANFKGFLKSAHEPSSRTLMKYATPYIDGSFEGETVLSIGKSVDFVKNNASGILSAIPFGCMPGTIVEALLKGLKNDTGIPCLSRAYDGLDTAGSDIQLEAFMHQAHEYMGAGKNSIKK